MAKTKKCHNCKKNQDLDLPTPTQDIVNPIIWGDEDINTVYTYLSETSKLRDPQIGEFSKKVFKDITGFELDLTQCMGCKSAKWKRMFRVHAESKLGIKLK